ncbi:hypothetical protein CQJ27_04355 [Escherichia sp. E1130]|nr:hypothetical protein CQB02_10765 [Escherichia coli]TGB75442.1 hypothetical protein CRI66_16560 [Escherichia sp. E4694]TGB92353.1 hypothetical protein CRG94_15890 [Escherichia sp. E3356]TGB95035.1 hypothetical protein CRI64_05650 [Escherichia sp. E2748]TGB97589.1 hypothetical protein CRG92_23870 [Escherichia sp. E2586]TGC08537.1 hypothetical protein CRG93_11265 [Escherichia sp. E2593]TGC17480.1 hypothetical protein CRU79_05760 [Escherichia sp. E4385]TGC18862.1 hypothetical protein CQJ28_05
MYLYDFSKLCNKSHMYNFSIITKLNNPLMLTNLITRLHFVTCLTLDLRFVMARLKSDVIH